MRAVHVLLALRSALVTVVLATLASALVDAGWAAWQGGPFWQRTGVVAMVLAALVAITGGTVLSRESTNEARALLGRGPDREEPDSGEHLTPVGVFLFVSVPLFLLGAVLVSLAQP